MTLPYSISQYQLRALRASTISSYKLRGGTIEPNKGRRGPEAFSSVQAEAGKQSSIWWVLHPRPCFHRLPISKASSPRKEVPPKRSGTAKKKLRESLFSPLVFFSSTMCFSQKQVSFEIRGPSSWLRWTLCGLASSKGPLSFFSSINSSPPPFFKLQEKEGLGSKRFPPTYLWGKQEIFKEAP